MAASYPTSVKSFTTKTDGVDTNAANDINALQDEVTAVETGLLSSGLTLTSGQIIFPATQNPSAGANTLDDYEEGAWTPVIGGSGGTSGQTYSAQSGRYIKVGSWVYAKYDMTLSAKGTITGSVQLQGLPFTSSAATTFAGGPSPIIFVALSTNWIALNATANGAATSATIHGIAAAGVSNTTSLVAADISNTTQMVGSVLYLASA